MDTIMYANEMNHYSMVDNKLQFDYLLNSIRPRKRFSPWAKKEINSDIDLIKDSLKDLLALQDKQVSLDNIKRKVAEYYKIKVADLMSKRRNRSVARPRQVAMAMAKELTHHSLPEIGDAFGGRDHTTVLHACRKIRELRDVSPDISEDYQNLLRALTT